MKKMIIDVSKLTYNIDFDFAASIFPLPLWVNWKGEVELIGRLKKTKGGGANWKAQNISSIPTHPCPRVHLAGEALVTTSPDRDFYEYEDVAVLQVLRLKGYEGRNFLLRVAFDGEVQDLSYRHERKEFIESFKKGLNRKPDFKQGHLEIWKISSAWTYDPDKLVFTGERTRILNHEIASERGKELSWVASGYSLLLHSHGEVYITSPHHLESPILLFPGCYFFVHPKPSAAD